MNCIVTEHRGGLLLQASVVSKVVSSVFIRKADSLPLVIMGANTSQGQKMAGIKAGAVDFLEKPLSSLKLRNVWQHTVRKVCRHDSFQSSGASSDTVRGPPSSTEGGCHTPWALEFSPRGTCNSRKPDCVYVSERCSLHDITKSDLLTFFGGDICARIVHIALQCSAQYRPR
jgi:hypothetical protein